MHPWVIILFVHYVGQRPAGGWEEESDLPGDPGAARSTDWAHQREKEACTGGSEQSGASCQGCSARWIKCLCCVQCWDIYSEYSIAWLWLYCCSYDFHCLYHCKYTVNVYEHNLFSLHCCDDNSLPSCYLIHWDDTSSYDLVWAVHTINLLSGSQGQTYT